jgi:multiple sugar transport system ATP-binding protein
MAAVSLSGLTKRFGSGPAAVESVTLDIRDGEFLTLLGPSGCGKSTLLRMLAGLEIPSSGEIRFSGEIVTHLGPAQRNIAMVFQSYALYPHMTVAENLGYPLRKRGIRRGERDRRIHATAALLKLDSLLDRKPRQLSGGQQQRVALGRAMIREPAVYLFDEPLSNLDATLRSYMRNELIRLHSKVSGTMIFVTHDQVEAMTMSDRIAVMEAGEIRQLGTPEEIYDSPRTRFVAGFVGTPGMNFLELEIACSGDGALLSSSDISLALPTPGDGRPIYVGPPRRITVGIRAEDVVPGAGDLRAEVAVVESLGNEQIVTLLVGSTELVLRTAARPKLRIGETVDIALQREKLHYFSAVTGERITL